MFNIFKLSHYLTLMVFATTAATAAAQEFHYQPLQPIQPLIPTYDYQLPNSPSYQLSPTPDYRMRIPAVPTFTPPQRRINPCDYGISRQQIDMMLQRQREVDRGLRRSNLANCAKYNIHCLNLLSPSLTV